MITWLLKEVEKNPTALFLRKDLIGKSKKEFEKLKRQRLLVYSQPSQYHETYPCPLPCSNTCPMEVVEMKGKLFAICPKDTEVDPIPLIKDDISKYRFSIDVLVEGIRKANDFTGANYSLTSRLYFMGEHVVEGINTAFVMAFFSNVYSAESHVLSLLARVPSDYERIVVVTPSTHLTNKSIYSKLRAALIFPVTLPSSFGQRDFKISYLAALKRRLPAGVSSQAPELTDNQFADCEEHDYKCRRDRLHVPGEIPYKRSNEIFLNGHKISLGDSLFALLMRFVVQLKKGKGGWVSHSDVCGEKSVEAGRYQCYSRLRTRLEGSLVERDAEKFIESSGSKQYRISMHPDFITYDKGKLRKHQHDDIKELAKKLPE